MTFDLAIVGSGFAGSLLAMIARRLGRSVVLIEKCRHPRFAIGESSTPLANLLLEELATRYDLPSVAPFAKWGTWQQAHPELPCGLKRGFSFFGHRFGEPFARHTDRRDQLLVAASPHDGIADTHWFRESFDQFFVREAQRAGVEFSDLTSLAGLERENGNFVLSGSRRGRQFRVAAHFVVDATGPRGFLHHALSLTEQRFEHLAETEGLFTHFRGVQKFADLGNIGGSPPFQPDDAALHHVFPGGWIWVLRFNNGVTSAGVAATPRLARELRFEDGEPAWERLLARLPTVREQFAAARPIRPFEHAPRLAFRSTVAVGPQWALLPSAAGFVDPLLSTGFALTLLGVTRLAEALEHDWKTPHFAERLAQYEHDTFGELDAAERLIAALYRRMDDFPKFTALSLAYFAAVSFAEAARRLGRPQKSGGFLLQGHPHFDQTMRTLCSRDELSPEEIGRAIAPFNIAGLDDRSRCNWHPVNASDLFTSAYKLGASRGEIERLLIRSGFFRHTWPTFQPNPEALMPTTVPALLFRIRLLVSLFIAGLVLAGVTAFPLVQELNLLASSIGADPAAEEGSLRWWIARVREGLVFTDGAFPFLAYGTDWLAFGHLVIAIFFIGTWRDPVRNVWIFHAGLIACAAVIPFAMIAGTVRGIPFYWRLIDCSFGIFGAIPLWVALRWTRELERLRAAPQE